MAFIDNDSVVWILLEGMIDLVFLTDMIFSFFSAYYNKIEALVSNHREIACGYIKSWFIIDLISIFPIQLLGIPSLNSIGKLARLPRIYHIIKASKFI